MIVGWTEPTAGGVRIYRSQMGRFFRDVANARSRETVIRRNNLMRSCAHGRREPYLLNRQHLDGNHIAVRMGWGPDRLA